MKQRGRRDWTGIITLIVVGVLLAGFIGASLLIPPWRDAVITAWFLIGLMVC